MITAANKRCGGQSSVGSEMANAKVAEHTYYAGLARARKPILLIAIISLALALVRMMYRIEVYINGTSLPNERIPTEGKEQQPIETEPVFVEEPDEDDEHLKDLKGDIQITHFFSTFSVPKTSPAYYEMKLVQESWKQAAMNAEKQGIKVEFIDFTLPGDDESSPMFSKRVDLKWWLKDVEKGQVPTTGEPFNLAQKLGRGKIMLFTNADIGVMPDFYRRAWTWSQTDFRTKDAQLKAMKETARFVTTCFYNFPARNPTLPLDHIANHLSMCAEDARVLYIHAGGFKELWEDERLRLAIAMMASKTRKKPKVEVVTQARWQDCILHMAPSLYKTVIEEAGENWAEYILNYKAEPPSPAQINELPKPLFAGTITRVDVNFTVGPSTWSGDVSTMYDTILGMFPKAGLKHPGNDAFLFHRDNLPNVVKMMGHPAGVRPFGHWLAAAWYMSEHPYRRITARVWRPWTFHLGIGLWGGDNIPWKHRASELPPYTVFLAANFDRLSGGLFQKMINDAPRVCKLYITPWRSIKFCHTVSNEFCAGNTRFGCYYYYNQQLRDVIWYKENCKAIHDRRQGRVKNPVCNFCNALLALDSSDKRFECDDGQMEYCAGLGEGVC